MDPLSANAAGLPTQLESEYAAFRNVNGLISNTRTKERPRQTILDAGTSHLVLLFC